MAGSVNILSTCQGSPGLAEKNQIPPPLPRTACDRGPPSRSHYRTSLQPWKVQRGLLDATGNKGSMDEGIQLNWGQNNKRQVEMKFVNQKHNEISSYTH